MIKTKQLQKKPKKSYRHGDLKNVLIDAAIGLIKKRNEVTFTIRELAILAGVTHAAAYRHFKSKRDILVQIAILGFSEMQKYFDESIITSKKKKTSSLQELAKAYILFASENPSHFRVMFHPDLKDNEDFPELLEISNKTFETLLACVDQNIELGRFGNESTDNYAMVAWSYVHGMATLFINGKFSPHDQKNLHDINKSAAILASLMETGFLRR